MKERESDVARETTYMYKTKSNLSKFDANSDLKETMYGDIGKINSGRR
tara:strand:- start:185 stop:328 length:144 start_codon:yes stop_codon:yes gene_type:complete